MSIHRYRAAKVWGMVLVAFAIVLTLLCVLGVRGHLPGIQRLVSKPVADPSPHRSGKVAVHGVHIHYLDWGGTGTALIFIPGFGSSAHIFDDFAPRFVDQFRAVAITRVGFGESDQPESGYDLASRIEQIRMVLDSLGITRAVLVGHSLGGDELTGFAGAYPERTASLVYLDAACDHVKALEWEDVLARFAVGGPEPSSADLAGADAYQDWIEHVRGVRFPVGEVLATMRFDGAGAVVGSRTADRVIEATRAAVQHPDYERVHAPALALFSDWETAADFIPWLRADPAKNTRATAVLRKKVLPEALAERARFLREVKGAQGLALPSHHYNFLSHPDEVERRMRAFLASLP